MEVQKTPKYKLLIVKIPESLKYRIDRTVLEEETTIKTKVNKILDDNFPHYEE